MNLNLTKKKLFSLIMAAIAFFLIVFSFLPYAGVSSYNFSLWSKDAGLLSFGIIQLLLMLAVMAVYLLHVFKGKKEKWIPYANYAVGFVVFTHLIYFFRMIDNGGSMVGFWFEFLLALGLGAISVLWNFQDDEQTVCGPKAPIVGYDEKTGKPIYAKIKSYDPNTGKPIYEKN